MLSFDERFSRTWKQAKADGGSKVDATLVCIFMATAVLEDALAWLRSFATNLRPFDGFWRELKFRRGNDTDKNAQWQAANANLNGIYRSLGLERPIVGSNRGLVD